MIVNKYHTFTDILVNNASKLPFSDRTFNFDLFSVRVAYKLFKQNTNTYTLSLFSLDDLIYRVTSTKIEIQFEFVFIR